MTLTRYLVVFGLLACACQETAQGGQGTLHASETTVFVNVNVIPMDREVIVPNQSVTVRDGKILSIAPTSQANIPASATRIDGRGKFLMPGLADMHAHLAHDEEADPDALVVFLAAGVTTFRNMWGQRYRRRVEPGHRNLGP